MELGLSGKRVLITGASKGIGRAVAETLAEEGCSLHLAARTEADLAAARDEINAKHGVQVTIHPMDLSDGDNMRRLAADTAGIDILVNNAGAIPGGDIETIDLRLPDRLIVRTRDDRPALPVSFGKRT